MLIIKGETRVDYFHLLCEACGNRVVVESLRMAGGVPAMTVTCKTCNETDVFKLDSVAWVNVALND